MQQHLGDDWARAVAMSSTEGLKRGMPVKDTGAPISVPVGEGAADSKSLAAHGVLDRGNRSLFLSHSLGTWI